MRVALVFGILLLGGCGGCASAPKADLAAEPATPSLGVHLIGYVPGGQACPVTEHVLITARHVVQPEPSEETGLRYFRFSTDYGVEGRAYGWKILWEADLAILVTNETLKYHRVAQDAPLPGVTVHSRGFDWRDEKRAYASREFSGEVVRTPAGHIVFKSSLPGAPGTSGSCVLADGSVVGIHVGRKSLDNERMVGVAPALWGKWYPQGLVNAAEKDRERYIGLAEHIDTWTEIEEFHIEDLFQSAGRNPE